MGEHNRHTANADSISIHKDGHMLMLTWFISALFRHERGFMFPGRVDELIFPS